MSASLLVMADTGPAQAVDGEGSIAGQIFDGSDEPFLGVQVQVYPVGSLSAPQADLTGVAGEYIFENLPDGDYIVQYFSPEGVGESAGRRYHWGYYSDSISWRYATPVSVVGGAAVIGIDSHLENRQLCHDHIDTEGPFPDVVDPSSEIFCEFIDWLEQMGLAEGYADGLYHPELGMTRQAMAAYIFRYLAEPGYVPPLVPTFSDVGTGHPFYAEIEWLASTGVTTGFDDGTFRPGQQILRQAMAAFLYRMADAPAFVPPATPSFPDVPTSHPFYDEVEWCVEHLVTLGFFDGTFRPGTSMTRRAMAAQLYRWDNAYPLFVDVS